MKKILNSLLFFLMGASFMGVILIITQCSKYDDWLSEGINPDQLTDMIDHTSIDKAGSAVEEALLSSDQTAIDNLVFKESLDFYKKNQERYTSDELAAIGKAFKNRKKATETKNFVEYTYTIDGKEYTMTMACEKEGVWKIIRY